MRIRLAHLVSTVNLSFTCDQSRARAPLGLRVAELLGARGSFAEIGVTLADRATWLARAGTWKLSAERNLLVDKALGHESDIAVEVTGDTRDARDVLDALWAALGEIAGEPPRSVDESLGTFSYQTTAVVELPKTLDELFPQVALLARQLRDRLPAKSLEPEGSQRFRVAIPITFAVGARTVERSLVIEPRFSAKTADRIYYTMSPLPSDEHLALLEDLCR